MNGHFFLPIFEHNSCLLFSVNSAAALSVDGSVVLRTALLSFRSSFDDFVQPPVLPKNVSQSYVFVLSLSVTTSTVLLGSFYAVSKIH